jgi:hypothetical protein
MIAAMIAKPIPSIALSSATPSSATHNRQPIENQNFQRCRCSHGQVSIFFALTMFGRTTAKPIAGLFDGAKAMASLADRLKRNWEPAG